MNTYRFFLMPLAVALVAALSFSVVAEDAKPADAAAPKHVGVKAEVTGKLVAKKFKNKQGEEKDGYAVTVASAKAADGKALDTLKGKELRVGAKNVPNVATFVGKDVTISGTVINDKVIRADSIK